MPETGHSPNLLLTFIFLLVIACLTAYYANSKGKNPMLWFALGLLLGIIAPIILFLLTFLSNNGQDKEADKPTMSVSQPDPALQAKSEPAPPTPEELRLKEQEEKLWYYLDQNHQQMGPVSLIALRELWNSGRLELTSYVWFEGMENWSKVDNLPELKETLSKTIY